MNLNDLALELTQREKGKKQVDIAQVKEILAHLGDIFYSKTLPEANELFGKLWLAGREKELKKTRRRQAIDF